MARLSAALIRLYPRDWRRRYGEEMTQMLEAQTVTLRSATDLVAGAIDARLNRQWQPAKPAGDLKGTTMTSRMFQCAGAGVSREDQWRSAAWVLGGGAVLTGFGLVLRASIGPNALSEALLYAAFPAALMLSNECTYFRPYSRAARLTMAIGGALLVVLILWAGVVIAYRV
jgi:hypothetical protein